MIVNILINEYDNVSDKMWVKLFVKYYINIVHLSYNNIYIWWSQIIKSKLLIYPNNIGRIICQYLKINS